MTQKASHLPGLSRCPSCGVEPCTPHRDGCEVERCSVCGLQRCQCDCVGHDPAFSRWTGIWPGEAEAIVLGFVLPGRSSPPVSSPTSTGSTPRDTTAFSSSSPIPHNSDIFVHSCYCTANRRYSNMFCFASHVSPARNRTQIEGGRFLFFIFSPFFGIRRSLFAGVACPTANELVGRRKMRPRRKTCQEL